MCLVGVRVLLLPIALQLGCGRVGFDPIDDVSVDGAVQPVGRSVSAGTEHSCAVVDGVLACWGLNTDGQLGVGDTMNRLAPEVVAGGPWLQVAAGSAHSCALASDGSVACWGANARGQLGVGD
jgi:alpha-tubulin suppressor-like RCC1 family protein